MEELGFAVIVVVIAIVIFLVCRELNCWYFKINAHISLMEKVIKNQEEIIALLKKDKEPAQASPIQEETLQPTAPAAPSQPE